MLNVRKISLFVVGLTVMASLVGCRGRHHHRRQSTDARLAAVQTLIENILTGAANGQNATINLQLAPNGANHVFNGTVTSSVGTVTAAVTANLTTGDVRYVVNNYTKSENLDQTGIDAIRNIITGNDSVAFAGTVSGTTITGTTTKNPTGGTATTTNVNEAFSIDEDSSAEDIFGSLLELLQ